MIKNLWQQKCTESHTRQEHGFDWDRPRKSIVIRSICNRSPRVLSYHARRQIGRLIPRAGGVLTEESARHLFLTSREELLDKLRNVTPVVNPYLRTALARLNQATRLTPSELAALSSVIGRSSIKNELDIESFYANEDEIDR